MHACFLSSALLPQPLPSSRKTHVRRLAPFRFVCAHFVRTDCVALDAARVRGGCHCRTAIGNLTSPDVLWNIRGAVENDNVFQIRVPPQFPSISKPDDLSEALPLCLARRLIPPRSTFACVRSHVLLCITATSQQTYVSRRPLHVSVRPTSYLPAAEEIRTTDPHVPPSRSCTRESGCGVSLVMHAQV